MGCTGSCTWTLDAASGIWTTESNCGADCACVDAIEPASPTPSGPPDPAITNPSLVSVVSLTRPGHPAIATKADHKAAVKGKERIKYKVHGSVLRHRIDHLIGVVEKDSTKMAALLGKNPNGYTKLKAAQATLASPTPATVTPVPITIETPCMPPNP